MLRDFAEQMFEIIIRFQVVGFRGFCNAVYNGARFCPCNRINHHPVLLTDTESTDRLLGGVVVHRHFSVIQEHLQIFFLVHRVLKPFPCLAFLWDFPDRFLCPRKISLHQRAYAQLAAEFPFFCRDAIQEDFNYKRVVLGRVSVQEIYKLMDEFGDRLLEKNIRHYLGIKIVRGSGN